VNSSIPEGISTLLHAFHPSKRETCEGFFFLIRNLSSSESVYLSKKDYNYLSQEQEGKYSSLQASQGNPHQKNERKQQQLRIPEQGRSFLKKSPNLSGTEASHQSIISILSPHTKQLCAIRQRLQNRV
jgi:hypothetical protein